MKLPKYPLTSGDKFQTFEFISEGKRGLIHKMVQYKQTNLKYIFNLAFGDKDNTTGDITLPGMFDCEIIAPRGTMDIPDIKVELTPNVGEFKIRVKATDDAKFYILECTQLAEDDSIILVTERQMDYATVTLVKPSNPF